MGESGLKEVVDTTPEKASQFVLFNAVIDATTGKVTYTPVSETVGNAVAIAEKLPPKAPHQEWLPFMSEDAKRSLASTDVSREPFLTSNAIKSPTVAERLMEDAESPLKLSELKQVEFSVEDLQMRDLVKKSGLKPENLQEFMRSLPPGTPEQRRLLIRKFLQENC